MPPQSHHGTKNIMFIKQNASIKLLLYVVVYTICEHSLTLLIHYFIYTMYICIVIISCMCNVTLQQIVCFKSNMLVIVCAVFSTQRKQTKLKITV